MRKNTTVSMREEVFGWLAIAAMAAMLFCGICFHPANADEARSASASQPTVTIQTANPYSFDVRLEVKCDWDGRAGRYAFHQWLIVPGKKQTLIKVPNSLKFCEIWPKVIF